MTVIPIVDQGLGNSAYLIDLGDGQGMVIDPERNPTPYLGTAERLGLHVRWVVETHLRADSVRICVGTRCLRCLGRSVTDR